MITNQQFKSYCTQIAELFCEEATNKVLCKANIYQRLINTFSDQTFPIFLSKLDQYRFYRVEGAVHVSGLPPHFKITSHGTDLITAETRQFYNGNVSSPSVKNSLVHIGAVFYDPEDPSKFYIRSNPSYGISYVPHTLPSPPSTGGGGSGSGSGGGNIVPTPPAPVPTSPMAPVGGSEDITNLLSNPIVLVGVGLGIYFLMKR